MHCFFRDKTCKFHKTRNGAAGERLCNSYFVAQVNVQRGALSTAVPRSF